MKEQISEERILEMSRSDHDEALRLVVDKYGAKLYRHIRRLVITHADADDVLQNTFIKVWRNLNSFRSESSLYTWLYSIATNESLLHIKERERRSGLSLDDLENFFTSSPEGDTWFDGTEAERKLHNAILKLPKKQRIVFNMKYFDDMTYEDISMALGTTTGALKASYHHAVKKLENFLKND